MTALQVPLSVGERGRRTFLPFCPMADTLNYVLCVLWVKVEGRIYTSPIRPNSLSVLDGQLLVTSHRQLVEYSGYGVEVGRVSLPSNVTLEHAAMTSRGTFIVCSRTTSRRKSHSASSSEELHQVARRTSTYLHVSSLFFCSVGQSVQAARVCLSFELNGPWVTHFSVGRRI